MAWATTLPRGSVDQHFLNFPVAITIKKPIVSTSWDAQPEWSVLFHHCLTCYWQCVLHCLQLGGEGMAPLKDRSSASALAEACINSVDMIHGDLNVFISCLAILAPEVCVVVVCAWVYMYVWVCTLVWVFAQTSKLVVTSDLLLSVLTAGFRHPMFLCGPAMGCLDAVQDNSLLLWCTCFLYIPLF